MTPALTAPLYYTVTITGYDAHGDRQRLYQPWLDTRAEAEDAAAELVAEWTAMGHSSIRTEIDAVR